jgi:pimeloyl-[acyl-carrier protein] methyl ester esterase
VSGPLALLQRGSGPPIVLLHGWALNSRVFDPLIERLSEGMSVYAIDLPGHGASPWPPRFSDLASLAAVVADALPPRAVVLGWSLGALVALELARTDAERVSALILVAATPRFLRTAHWPHGVAPQLLDHWAAELQANHSRMVADFLDLQVRGAEHPETALAALQGAVLGSRAPNPEALGAALDILRTTDLTPRLAAIHQPALVIAGQYDRVTSPTTAAALAAALPHARAVIMPRAAHAPFLSHRDEFLNIITPFLEEQRGPSTADAGAPDAAVRGTAMPSAATAGAATPGATS